MTITVERRFKRPGYTIGRMAIDGEYFCETLEDAVRDIAPDGTGKIPGETAIPAGTYEIILNTSPRFMRELPRLMDVPHFSGVLIHRGNWPRDTEGCILIGENKIQGAVINSTKYELRLVERIRQAVENNEPVKIIIT